MLSEKTATTTATTTSAIKVLVLNMSDSENPYLDTVDLAKIGVYMWGRRLSLVNFTLLDEVSGKHMQISTDFLSADITELQEQVEAYAKDLNALVV